jgi:spore coat protein U-like protein
MKNKDVIFAAILLFLIPCAFAATTTATLSVTASVAAVCTVSATSAVAFGTYNTQSVSDQAGTGSISVRCTKGSSGVTIGLNTGVNGSGSQARMTDGSTNFINYALYQPTTTTPGAACPTSAATGTAWTNTGAGLFTLTAAPSNVARTYNVCGFIPNSQDVPAGSYTDTVTATVTF